MPETENRTCSDYTPRRYSFRDSALTAVKLLAIGGVGFAALWLLDALVTQ